jgi:hypothetical protein
MMANALTREVQYGSTCTASMSLTASTVQSSSMSTAPG